MSKVSQKQLGLRGVVTGRPQAATLPQAAGLAEGKTEPCGPCPAEQSSQAGAANQPLGILPRLPLGWSSPLVLGVHDFCKTKSQRNDTQVNASPSPVPVVTQPWDKTPFPHGKASRRGCDGCVMQESRLQRACVAALQLACRAARRLRVQLLTMSCFKAAVPNDPEIVPAARRSTQLSPAHSFMFI